MLALQVPFALESPPPRLSARRTSSEMRVDGALDEAAWRAAPVSVDFTQKFPREGRAPTEATRVRVLYDDRALYFGIECVQASVPIVAPLTRRDREVESDRVTVGIDSRHDGTTAFEFSVTPAGVLADAVRFNDTESSVDWDENWEARTRRDAHGWTAEIRIPFAVLRFSNASSQVFGLQVRRYVSARQETDEWSFIPRSAGGEVSRYGRLEGIDGIEPRAGLELRPFVLGRVRRLDETLGAADNGWGLFASAGLDLKWHVTPSLTFDATLLPDFGQVEADQVILNLTNFELYYPEKRPFFLEGIDAFATPLQIVYTRRLGRAPTSPALLEGERIARLPDPSPLLGAAKLTGEIDDRWSIGSLVALSARQTVPIEDATGARVERIADPLTSYKVLRLKRAIGGNAHVGFLGMATNRLEPARDLAQDSTGVLCADGARVRFGARCSHDAYVGGVDARWRSRGGDYSLAGQVLASLIEQGPTRTMLDGTSVKSGDGGVAASLSAAKEGGEHWVGSATYDLHGRKVDYNDLGYMERQNQHHLSTRIEYRTLQAAGPIAETHTGLEIYGRRNLDFVSLSSGVQINTQVRFENYWSLFAELHVRPAYFDDRETGDGAALERAGRVGLEIEIATDPRGAVSASFFTQTQLRTNGANFSGNGSLKIRALPELELELLPEGLFTDGEPRFFGLHAGSYRFGRQRAEELSLTARATYTLSPRLGFQAYAQAFLAAEHFGEIFASPIGGAPLVPLDGLTRSTLMPGEAPDTSQAALNANLLLRWEYRLGSVAYLVYTHAQNDSRAPFRGEDGEIRFRLLQPRPASDAFLLKCSYWWG